MRYAFFGSSHKLQILQPQVGPSHYLIILLKVGMLSANLISLGRAFHISGPNDRRLFDPKVT